MKHWMFTVFPALLLASASSLADPFECNGQYIEAGVGTLKEQVLAQCGPPTAKSENRWYYMNQPGQVTVIIYFVNDQVESIRQVLHQ